MKKILKKTKLYFIFIGILLISSLLLSFLNILGVSKGITTILSIIIMIITFMVMGFFKGKEAHQKGYVQGLKIGASLILILLIFGFIFSKIHLKSFLYYCILLLSSIFGAMLGINKKEL